MAQNSIIELQVVNYAVKNKDIDWLRKANISPTQFSDENQALIQYVFDHTEKYKVVPDETTMVGKFGDDYPVISVTESPAYLMDKLKSFLSYVEFGKAFQVARKQIEEGNMESALPFLKDSIEKTMKIYSTNGVGTDIISNIDRLQEYETRLTNGEETLSLGIDALDEAFGGLLLDDLFLIFARLGHGKSYLMTYFAHVLHKQGRKILFYSGEMDASQVGYRYDSIDSGFSNKDLLFGRPLKGTKNVALYETYLKNLAKNEVFFKVITPSDLGGRFINMNDLRNMAEEYKPDVIFVDQLSLVDDIKSTKATLKREKYDNIMADLRVLAQTKRIPIFVAAQANRQSATKDDEGDFTVPEMEHIAESDAVGHHCTRAIGFCTNKEEDSNLKKMKIAIKKNRHGGESDFKLEVDFEHGRFEELKNKPLRSETVPVASGKF